MRFIVVFILVTFAGMAAWIARHIIPLSGAFSDLKPTLVEQCRKVEIAPGTEDVTIDHARGVAYIAAGDRRNRSADGTLKYNPANGIYQLALDGSDAVTKISPDIGTFMPHGLSLWRGKDDGAKLFAINHVSSGEELVEIFEINPDGTLTHEKTVRSSLMYSLNDLVAVGPSQFYATNDQRFAKGILSALETYLALPLTDIVYFDGEKSRRAAKRLVYANGINVSADGTDLYVAEILKRRITGFDRDPKTNELTNRRYYNAGTAPDNIDIATDGALWIGAHPAIFKFLGHAKNANNPAPSEVVRMDLFEMRRERIFVSVDGEINASSVGAPGKDMLVIGAVFDSHVMVCPLAD